MIIDIGRIRKRQKFRSSINSASVRFSKLSWTLKQYKKIIIDMKRIRKRQRFRYFRSSSSAWLTRFSRLSWTEIFMELSKALSRSTFSALFQHLGLARHPERSSMSTQVQRKLSRYMPPRVRPKFTRRLFACSRGSYSIPNARLSGSPVLRYRELRTQRRFSSVLWLAIPLMQLRTSQLNLAPLSSALAESQQSLEHYSGKKPKACTAGLSTILRTFCCAYKP